MEPCLNVGLFCGMVDLARWCSTKYLHVTLRPLVQPNWPAGIVAALDHMFVNGECNFGSGQQGERRGLKEMKWKNLTVEFFSLKLFIWRL